MKNDGGRGGGGGGGGGEGRGGEVRTKFDFYIALFGM